MTRFLAITRTGAASVLLHPLRSAVTVACVVSILSPYVAGLGLSAGLHDEALESVRSGADLYVSGRRLGRDVPIPIAAATAIRSIPGVTDVVPRITGEIALGTDAVSAVLVGLPADRLPKGTSLVSGSLFAAGAKNELVVGSRLARRLSLAVGSKIPPFYRNDQGERVSTVVGVFRADLPVWEANLVFASLETASDVFGQKGLASTLLVSCESGRTDDIRRAVLAMPSLAPDDGFGPLRARVTTREDLGALLPRGFVHREGVFTLAFLLAFAVGIPLVLVTSGVGLSERRRETGLLKATGWQTDEILLRGAAESLLLAVAAASISILAAFLWLRVLGGAGLGPVFYGGLDLATDVEIPYRLAPAPVLVAAAMAFVLVVTGTLVSSWRAASAPPAEAMR